MRAEHVTARPGHDKGAQGKDLGSAAGGSRQGWLRGAGGNVTENEAPPSLFIGS